jgi:hypothetical protein
VYLYPIALRSGSYDAVVRGNSLDVGVTETRGLFRWHGFSVNDKFLADVARGVKTGLPPHALTDALIERGPPELSELLEKLL